MIRILLADDEPVFRRSLAIRLRMRGYEVLETGDGAETLCLIREDSDIAAIILDHRMPGSESSRLRSDIRRLRPDLPVILLTGMVQPEISGDPRLHGLFACLEKPCNLDDLIGSVEAACRTKRIGQEA